MSKKQTPEERGYIPIADAARGLRALADDIEKQNVGRLAKIDINVWYENVPEIQRASSDASSGTTAKVDN